MSRPVWVVIGGIGGKKDGVLVRCGKDTNSAEEDERLGSLSVVEELELEDGRLQYKIVSGTGPQIGWISTQFKGKDLVAKPEEICKVIGGKDSGGIVVRQGIEMSSPAAPERLSFGAVFRVLSLQGERINFDKLKGAGPGTGWVSTNLKGRSLIALYLEGDQSQSTSSQAPAPDPPGAETQIESSAPPVTEPALPYGTTGEPLEIRMFNEEKGFSYEGYPQWVAEVAAMARLRREGKPYLPTADEPLPRLGKMQPLPPFKRIPPKKLKELLPFPKNGDMFGLPIPRSAEQMESAEFGPEWFTNAFHAAGTLAEDNKVTKVVVKEMPCTGFAKEGGAAMKAFVTVEYLNPDPSLHTELFAKYTWDFWRGIPGLGMTMGQDDGLEVTVCASICHMLPLRSPQFYFGDLSRENTSFIVITEAIPYSKRDGQEKKTYEVLPGLGKCQDHLLTNPAEFYFCLFRAMGQMGAWDHLGRFDSLYGPKATYNEETYLAMSPRQPQTKAALESTMTVVGQTADKTISFLTEWCQKIACAEVRNSAALQKVKKELQEMGPYFSDMSNYYQNNNTDYISMNHMNFQADNAWFWRDEYGELDCGVLDMGGFGRGAFASRFAGCVTGADADILVANLEGMVQFYVDEYRRCGGPQVSSKEVVLRFHLCFITALFDLQRVVADHVFKETTKEEFTSFTGELDERYQERFLTRCGSLPAINVWTYYVKKGNLKKVFDDWATGAGKPYLTVYA